MAMGGSVNHWHPRVLIAFLLWWTMAGAMGSVWVVTALFTPESPSLPLPTNATPVAMWPDPTATTRPLPTRAFFVETSPHPDSVDPTNLESIFICDGRVRRFSCETGSAIDRFP